ncbi:MAG: hypothetical protein CVV64_02710 [Candidatus Wallbacteria bacterium HGW-Wallbacteria-1]|jgi:sugar lactone lactonase YvrE|uniref:Uncharacterized protein n=1 Tax=Candidatus Wallbacteria bacterium HGW-Wallbacteria-1 TaxID=2013854 RepID=A0A2N1PTK2_9BACT|nr:MAG: hypothetical protein CVV64_02710 [Candidatus Wallbacteria bacterium HGW-Wallbacteria-1]
MNCLQCGQTTTGPKHCTHCGAHLPTSCPSCGWILSAGHRHCGNCGRGTAAATIIASRPEAGSLTSLLDFFHSSVHSAEWIRNRATGCVRATRANFPEDVWKVLPHFGGIDATLWIRESHFLDFEAFWVGADPRVVINSICLDRLSADEIAFAVASQTALLENGMARYITARKFFLENSQAKNDAGDGLQQALAKGRDILLEGIMEADRRALQISGSVKSAIFTMVRQSKGSKHFDLKYDIYSEIDERRDINRVEILAGRNLGKLALLVEGDFETFSRIKRLESFSRTSAFFLSMKSSKVHRHLGISASAVEGCRNMSLEPDGSLRIRAAGGMTVVILGDGSFTLNSPSSLAAMKYQNRDSDSRESGHSEIEADSHHHVQNHALHPDLEGLPKVAEAVQDHPSSTVGVSGGGYQPVTHLDEDELLYGESRHDGTDDDMRRGEDGIQYPVEVQESDEADDILRDVDIENVDEDIEAYVAGNSEQNGFSSNDHEDYEDEEIDEDVPSAFVDYDVSSILGSASEANSDLKGESEIEIEILSDDRDEDESFDFLAPWEEHENVKTSESVFGANDDDDDDDDDDGFSLADESALVQEKNAEIEEVSVTEETSADSESGYDDSDSEDLYNIDGFLDDLDLNTPQISGGGDLDTVDVGDDQDFDLTDSGSAILQDPFDDSEYPDLESFGIEGDELIDSVTVDDFPVQEMEPVLNYNSEEEDFTEFSDENLVLIDSMVESGSVEAIAGSAPSDLQGDLVFVVDTGNNRIQVFNTDGEFLYSFGQKGAASGQFDTPKKLFVDPSGFLLVADFVNCRIQKFDLQGKHLLSFGNPGTNHGEFNYPMGLTTDSDGRVFVVDAWNNRIQVFDPDGKFMTRFGEYGDKPGQFNSPNGIRVAGDGNLVITDSGNNRVQIFSPDGDLLSHFGRFGSSEEPGEFDTPSGIAIDADGRIHIADTGNNRIQIFDSTANFINSFGSWGDENGSLDTPNGIHVSTDGKIFVADTWNHRVQVFDSSGSYLNSFGGHGSGDGYFIYASDLYIHSTQG